MENTKTAIANTGWFNSLTSLFQEHLDTIFRTIFDSMQALVHSEVSYSVIVVTIMVWLLNKLKTGYPTKSEWFDATKWLVTTLFVLGIFVSFDGYTQFLSWLTIPSGWVKEGVSALFDFTKNGGNVPSVISLAVDSLNNLKDRLVDYGIKKNENLVWYNRIPKDIGVYFGLLFFWIYYLVFIILIVAIVAIIIASQFIAGILLACAPIFIPFLINKSLKQYFFSWLKLYISYSLYPSVAFIILGIAMRPMEEIRQKINADVVANLYEATMAHFISYIITTTLCVYMLTKIPNWISQIMGVQGLESGGVGAGKAMMATAGTATGAGLAAGAAAKMTGSGWMSSLGSMAKGMTSTLPGAKTMGNALDKVRKAKASKNSVTQGDATASPG